MSLNCRYDQFYASSLQDEKLTDIVVSEWSNNRTEAIIFVSDKDEMILGMGRVCF